LPVGDQLLFLSFQMYQTGSKAWILPEAMTSIVPEPFVSTPLRMMESSDARMLHTEPSARVTVPKPGVMRVQFGEIPLLGGGGGGTGVGGTGVGGTGVGGTGVGTPRHGSPLPVGDQLLVVSFQTYQTGSKAWIAPEAMTSIVPEPFVSTPLRMMELSDARMLHTEPSARRSVPTPGVMRVQFGEIWVLGPGAGVELATTVAVDEHEAVFRTASVATQDKAVDPTGRSVPVDGEQTVETG
jgi:hypothetical protein